MKLIEISHLSRSRQATPTVSFLLSGHIRINHQAVDKIFPEAFTESSDKKCYLKFYKDEEKFAIQMNTHSDNGLLVRFDGGSVDRRNASNIITSAKSVITHLAKLFDWPLANDKRKVIRYEIGEEIGPGIFELV